MELEIGGGDRPRYHPNMDIQELPTVDIVHDIRELSWPLRSDYFDLVYSSHCFEHLKIPEVHNVLNEVYRILKKGGVLELHVPDIGNPRQVNEPWESVVKYIYGDQKDEYSFHYVGFWQRGLWELLQSHGFADIDISESKYGCYPELTALCRKA